MASVIIIGGGVSGLVAASYLAKCGINTQLIESGDKLGGCCATTTLDGYTFNDGAMFLAMPGMLQHLFAELGINDAGMPSLRKLVAGQAVRFPDGFEVVLSDGLSVELRQHDKLQSDASMRSDLQKLVSKWEPVLNLFAEDILLKPLSPWQFLLKGWQHLPKLRGSVASELNKMIQNPYLRSTLSGALQYTGVAPEKLPIFSILGVVSMLRDGFFVPEGGMGVISQVLAESARKNGVDITLGKTVKRVLSSNGRVKGVELETGEQLSADAIISSLSGMLTYGRLMEPGAVPRAIQRKVTNAPLSQRAISLQLGLANNLSALSPSVCHNNAALPLMDKQSQALAPQNGDVRWINFSVPTVTLPELAPEGGSVVEMYLSVDPGLSLSDWDEARRDEIVDRNIAALKELYPLDIVAKRVRSPKDFSDQLGLFEGALYGLSPAANPSAQFPHKSPVPGLFHAGQTTYPGFGVATSGLSGLFAAQAVLSEGFK